MLPYAIAATVIYLPLRAVYLQKHRRRFAAPREILLCLFMIVTVAVSSQTVFTSLSGFSIAHFGHPLNLIPGKTLAQAKISDYVFLIGLLGNIAVFIPMGFFLPLLFRKADFKRTMLFGFSLSLCYELLQLPLDRSTDIDDLILNTLGTLIGFLLARLLQKCFPKLLSLAN